jgi:hypothetical protein
MLDDLTSRMLAKSAKDRPAHRRRGESELVNENSGRVDTEVGLRRGIVPHRIDEGSGELRERALPSLSRAHGHWIATSNPRLWDVRQVMCDVVTVAVKWTVVPLGTFAPAKNVTPVWALSQGVSPLSVVFLGMVDVTSGLLLSIITPGYQANSLVAPVFVRVTMMVADSLGLHVPSPARGFTTGSESTTSAMLSQNPGPPSPNGPSQPPLAVGSFEEVVDEDDVGAPVSGPDTSAPHPAQGRPTHEDRARANLTVRHPPPAMPPF